MKYRFLSFGLLLFLIPASHLSCKQETPAPSVPATEVSVSSGKVYILCYHTFIDKNFGTDFSPVVFKAHMNKIKALGYNFVSWSDIAAGKVTGDHNVLITIDDGNKSVIPVWQDILKPMGIRPLLFLYPGVLGRVHYAMKYSQIRELVSQGVELGVHGYYHEYVGKKLYDRNPADFWREIKTARSTLEKNLDYTFTVYAYPFGYYDDLTLKSIAEAEYSYAFKLGEKPLSLPLPQDGRKYLLPRYLMNKGSWPALYRELKENAPSLPQS